MKFLEEFKLQKKCNQCSSKICYELVEVIFWLVDAATACLNGKL